MLQLTYAPGTVALAAHIALYDVGAEFEPVRLDFAAGEQRGSDYLALNPKGRVPALITERGVLSETPAILLYLAQRFPDAGMAPLDDPFALAEAQAFNTYLCATVHVAHAHGRRGSRWVDDEAAMAAMKAKLPESMSNVMRLVEDGMLKGPWVLGERYSICDPYLFTVARWLKVDGVDEAKFPRVTEHSARMAERDSVKRAQADQAG